ncbi:outer membrane protein assembly factor BamB [Thalassotalea sp. 1_MG-2023]|uniref:outer membrane protein assembly factor BamB n=1 Tax=Thalassotalea sp. 1_MG-2023 TaxID=3062680 RepID=UPI0026E3387B|nr:outer membrane protein assembly factor BamB [Thalassotalea sp. 1_MG-2023]MDO6427447.1 outer membrane protein assembly factor BamB [Thalassotalea sp. 1_MG-2023]
MLKITNVLRHKTLLMGCLLTGLMACSSTDDEIDPNEPVELTEITERFEAEVAWEESIGGVGKYFSRITPLVAYDKLYSASREGEVYAMDPATGKELWRTDLRKEGEGGFFSSKPTAFLNGGPTAAMNKVFIGSENGDVYALDAETGELSWHSKVKGEVLSAPGFDAGVLVVNTASGVVKAFNATDGETLWQIEQDVPPLTLRGTSSPALAAGGAVVGAPNGSLTVYLLESGQQGWTSEIGEATGSTELDRVVDIDSSPIIYGDKAYSISARGNLASVDLRSGRVLWKRQYSSYRDLEISGNTIYLTDVKGHVYAIDRVNGTEKWSQLALTNRNVTGPKEFDNYIVVGDFEGYVHWLDKESGDIVARHHVDGSGVYATPTTDGNLLFVLSKDGDLQAIKKP